MVVTAATQFLKIRKQSHIKFKQSVQRHTDKNALEEPIKSSQETTGFGNRHPVLPQASSYKCLYQN